MNLKIRALAWSASAAASHKPPSRARAIGNIRMLLGEIGTGEAGKLTKQGFGTLTLTGTNTYSGTTAAAVPHQPHKPGRTADPR